MARQSWQDLFSISWWLEPWKAMLVAVPVVCLLGGNLGPYGSCWAGGVFRKGLLLRLILSMWQQKQRLQCSLPFLLPFPTPCPGSAPFPAHAPALLGILELPRAWRGALCLPWCGSTGKVRWGCWGLEQESLRAGAPRLGQMTLSSYSSPSRSPLIPPSPFLESYCNLHICDAFCPCRLDDLFTTIQSPANHLL